MYENPLIYFSFIAAHRATMSAAGGALGLFYKHLNLVEASMRECKAVKRPLVNILGDRIAIAKANELRLQNQCNFLCGKNYPDAER